MRLDTDAEPDTEPPDWLVTTVALQRIGRTGQQVFGRYLLTFLGAGIPPQYERAMVRTVRRALELTRPDGEPPVWEAS